MKVTAVVLFKGALAHYTVALIGDGTYEASLLKYSGDKLSEPPRKVHFKKMGRHCMGDTDEQDLMDDICYAVLTKVKADKGSSGSVYSPKTPYVAI